VTPTSQSWLATPVEVVSQISERDTGDCDSNSHDKHESHWCNRNNHVPSPRVSHDAESSITSRHRIGEHQSGQLVYLTDILGHSRKLVPGSAQPQWDTVRRWCLGLPRWTKSTETSQPSMAFTPGCHSCCRRNGRVSNLLACVEWINTCRRQKSPCSRKTPLFAISSNKRKSSCVTCKSTIPFPHDENAVFALRNKPYSLVRSPSSRRRLQ
jgi:hypothetical protein